MISSSNSLLQGSGMPYQVDGALVHAMSGNELSRVRTEFRLHPPEPIKRCLLESRADIVMQSSCLSVFSRNPVGLASPSEPPKGVLDVFFTAIGVRYSPPAERLSTTHFAWSFCGYC